MNRNYILYSTFVFFIFRKFRNSIVRGFLLSETSEMSSPEDFLLSEASEMSSPEDFLLSEASEMPSPEDFYFPRPRK